MSRDSIVHSYGLALWLMARGVPPLSATLVGQTVVYAFPQEANGHAEAFQAARRQLTALQQAVGFVGGAR